METVPLSPGKIYKYVKVVQVAKPNISSTPHLVPVRVIPASALQSHQSPRIQIITDKPSTPTKQNIVVQQTTTPVQQASTPVQQATTPVRHTPNKPTLPPNVRIKIEELDDELTVDCQLCTKSFYNPIALKNHVASMHFGQEVDINDWCVDYYEAQKKLQEARVAAAAAALEADVAQAAQEVAQEVPKPKKPSTPRNRQVKQELSSEEIAQNRAHIVANMKPLTMDAIVKEEFNYLLLKETDDDEFQEVEEEVGDLGTNTDAEGNKTKRKRKRKPPVTVEEKVAKQQKSKEGNGIEGPFVCLEPSNVSSDGVCHQIFFCCCQYSIHYRDEHTRRRKFIRCQVCEKLLLNGSEDFQFPYTCETCGAGFDTHKSLIEHSSHSHIKIKPYQCPVCTKKFTQIGGLNQHLRMHRGERPFPCTFCPKAFTQKSGLEQHMRIHTKEKPYKCVICTKAFKQSIHLKQHMRTHTNLAPFQCLVCQKRFKQASHLNYHFKYHSEDNMTEEQKNTYKSLMGALESSVYQVEIDSEQNEVVVNDQISEQAINEQNEAIEHVIVESDQLVIEDDREYILSDNGDETWSVKVVDRVDQ